VETLLRDKKIELSLITKMKWLVMLLWE